MSRPKKFFNASPPAQPQAPAANVTQLGRRGRVRLMGLIAALVAVTIYFVTNESARSCYQRAQSVLPQDPRQAERLAERAVLKAGGNYPAAQLLQCRALAATEQWDAAYGGLSLIKDTSTCNPDELLALGETALNAGQFDLAARALRGARVPGSSLSRATELLVRLELQFRRTDEALALCQEWQNSLPDAYLPWVIAGDVAKSSVDLGAAIAAYREALKRSPPAAIATEVRSSLAQLLVLTGDVVAARKEFDTLLKVGPLQGKLQLMHAQLLRLEGRLDEALTEVEHSLKASGSTPEALKQRGIIKLDLGRVKEALADLEQSVKGNPYDVGTHHKLAQAHLRLGQKQAAQPHLDQARRLTDATIRISDVQNLLRTDPDNQQLQQELRELSKTLGRGIEPPRSGNE